MKKNLARILTLLALTTAPLAAHEGLEMGPNDGRVFELGSKTTPHIEVGQKDGKFIIHVLDKNDKTVPVGERTLAITAGERSAPEKLKVEKTGEAFTAPIPKGEKFLVVFQVRESDGAKPLTARMTYEAAICSDCKRPEWLCTCGDEEKPKKGKK